jgi:isoaspartyl peptidase/L-asparaginase-like protein (Ntn-hydrolase superfamily)
MEKTPHVLLVGAGAEQFAREQGVEVKENSLDEEQEAKLTEWCKEKLYAPKINIENHDTISVIALDQRGCMVAGSSTSGLAFKMHGRVGDSPIIGSGIFVDKEVGAAVCTGLGEAVLRTVGAHSVIEAMRYGKSP